MAVVNALSTSASPENYAIPLARKPTTGINASTTIRVRTDTPVITRLIVAIMLAASLRSRQQLNTKLVVRQNWPEIG